MMPTRRQLANAIRALSMDAVQKANSGHPGMPMGMADIAQVLWADHLRHNPGNPDWPGRDRFVLSNGHGSMLLYSLLHLTGYPLGIEQLQAFRQFGSHTAGHPEVDAHLGIETTTGPLGQGLANAVGMALAEKVLAATFNRPGHEVVDHRTWVLLGDGCLMEGVSHEACALAGTLKLGKLVCFYDDNGISIDGEVHGWFTDDHAEALRGLRLAGDTRRRRPRRRCGRSRHRCGHGGRHATDARLLQDHHRLRCAEQAGHRGHAWRGPRRCRGGGGAAAPRLALRAVRDPGRHQARVGRH